MIFFLKISLKASGKVLIISSLVSDGSLLNKLINEI